MFNEKSSWHDYETNQAAIENPQIGDYWHERFCPYFVIVDIIGDKYIILCAWDYKDEARNARVDLSSGWYWDYSKHSVVTKEWLYARVIYDDIPDFVADVVRSDKWKLVAKEWKEENPNFQLPVKPKLHEEYWLGV